MVFYGIVMVAVIAFLAWFVRTPTFRHHRQGRGKIPGQDANHAEPYYDNSSSAYFRKPD